MENASKALLIAGAILIAILLIAVAMSVFNNSKSTVNSGLSQVDSNETQMFNSQFKQYEGKDRSANDVKAVLRAVLASNAANNGNTDKKVTTVKIVKWDGNNTTSTTVGDSAIINNIINTKVVDNAKYTIKLIPSNTTGFINNITITRQ